MSFDPAPVRLRRKAAKQLKQTNAQQLELETKKMEERIRALKEQMMREKEERERSGGIKWNSSKSGAFANARTQAGTKKKSPKGEKGPRKIKILTDEPLSSYVRKSITQESPIHSASTGGALCGQCDRTRAGLICVECGENYCAECFKTFHQKGALKRHTAKSLCQNQDDKSRPSSRNRVLSQTARPSGLASDSYLLQNGSPPRQQGGSLLKGSYNEEESSASFAQALREWRNSHVVKNANTWVNPADVTHNEISTGTSVGSDTITVAAKLKEIKIEFKENNTLSYMDRLLLKKHRKNPLQGVAKPTRPVSVGVSSRKNTKPRLSNNNHINENDESKGELGLNYREMLQNVCSNAGKLSQEARNRRSHCEGEVVGMKDSSCGVTIEEVLFACDALEETSVCVVEETMQGNSPLSVARPPSQSGRISIMTLTSTGDFREDVEALTLEDVSSLSSGSPTSESRYPVRHSADPFQTTSSRAASKTNVGSNDDRTSQTKKTANYVSSGVPRVWSPKLSYTGLSNFFLSGGVKADVQPSEILKREGSDIAIGPRAHVSRVLLHKAVWKPEDSVIICDVTDVEDTLQNDSCSQIISQPLPLPIVQVPKSDGNTAACEVVPVVSEPEPDSKNTGRLKSGRSHQQDSEATQKIHDFDIVDFLQAGPIPSKGQNDYNLVHRVSTVSPLALSPNPPKLNWSDDDSDDDFIEEIVSRVQLKESLLRDKQDQDFDDSATLTNLAWELESTAGKLTPATVEADSLMTTQNTQGGRSDQFSQDSIEGDEFGTELNFPDEIDCDIDSLDGEDEDRASRMEVAALD